MRAGVYKSPPAATYGCEKEEAGGLNLSAVPVQKNLPPGTRLGSNENAFLGGFYLWQK